MPLKIPGLRWLDFPLWSRYTLLNPPGETQKLSLDLEWSKNGEPTLIGLAFDKGCSCWRWNAVSETKLRSLLARTDELIGHNIIQSDIPALQKHLVFPIIPAKTFDTLIYFYLTNAHLCKARVSKPREYEKADQKHSIWNERRGGGFMNLWTMASLYTDLPNWKLCRNPFADKAATPDSDCTGPCPIHNPFGYNATDAIAAYLARDPLEREAIFKQVNHLYPMLEQTSSVAARMTERGIRIDINVLDRMELEMEANRLNAADGLPPEMFGEKELSPRKILAYFKDKYGVTPLTTSEEDLEAFYEEYQFEEAEKLLEYKAGGKGLAAWFDRRYIQDGCIHPNFYPAGATATGRWASSNPNFQNIPVRRSKDIRRLIVPRPGCRLVKADFQQAEARVVLYESGYQVPADETFKEWLIASCALDPDDPGVRALGGVWNATKSFVHANHYLEGIKLFTKEELRQPYYVNEIAKGALRVYEDWKYKDYIVCFTGVNLAARMYGSATFENRAKALRMRETYYRQFPGVLDFQKRVAKEVELSGATRSPFGFYLQVYGEEAQWRAKSRMPSNLKTAMAMRGSNPVAMFTNLAILNADRDGTLPLAQIHDELLFEFPEGESFKRQLRRVADYMRVQSDAMPGFEIPVAISAGKNWAEMEKISL